MGFCARFGDPGLAAAVELLRVVAGQDIEIAVDADGARTPRIAQRVAPGRVVSTVDPDARHGHRSRTDRYDGYKLHVSADVDSDLICSAAATLATVHDAAVVEDLIDADPVPVAEIIADTHYGSGPTRQAMADRGIDLVAPAQPIPARGDMLTKADFDIDLDTATVTCPQGNTAPIPPPTRRQTAPGAVRGNGLFSMRAQTPMHHTRRRPHHRDQPPRRTPRPRTTTTLDTRIPQQIPTANPSRTQNRTDQIPHQKSPLARPRQGQPVARPANRRPQPRPRRPPRHHQVTHPPRPATPGPHWPTDDVPEHHQAEHPRPTHPEPPTRQPRTPNKQHTPEPNCRPPS